MARHTWQWSLQQIKAPPAWLVTQGDPEVIVAVLDTGIDPEHPELKGKVLPGFNMVVPTAKAADDNGHGTAVASIIAAEGCGLKPRFRGVAPRCRLMPIKANLPRTGHVRAPQIAHGILKALELGADVINLSVGCELDEPGFDHKGMSMLANAVYEALRQGVPVVCAGGPPNKQTYPAAWSMLEEYAGLIAVGATSRGDRLHEWSPRWPYVTLVAPAEATAAFPMGRYGRFGGTSAASPHVAGVVALIRTLRPDLSPKEIRDLLLESADPVQGGRFLRVNAQKTMEALRGSGRRLRIMRRRRLVKLGETRYNP